MDTSPTQQQPDKKSPSGQTVTPIPDSMSRLTNYTQECLLVNSPIRLGKSAAILLHLTEMLSNEDGSLLMLTPKGPPELVQVVKRSNYHVLSVTVLSDGQESSGTEKS